MVVIAEEEQYIYNSKDVLDAEACVEELKNWMVKYHFEAQHEEVK